LILVCFACFSLNLLSFNSNPNQTQNQAFSFFVSFEYFLLAQGMNN
jgi:prephenate dehydratase